VQRKRADSVEKAQALEHPANAQSPLPLSAGAHELRTAPEQAFSIDQLVLSSDTGGTATPVGADGRPVLPPAPPATPVRWTQDSSSKVSVRTGRTDEPSWLVLGQSFNEGWEASGGTVLDVVTWPEEAASWLRQATRFAAADPDLWVMAGAPLGWAQMTRRLLWSTPWQPERTLAFAVLGTKRAIELVGAYNLQGLAGATSDGGTWTVRDGSIHTTPRNRGIT